MPRRPSPPARRRLPSLSLPASLADRGLALRRQREADSTALRVLYGAHRARELAMAPWPAAAKARFLDEQFRLQSAHFAAQHSGADFLILVCVSPPLADEVIGRLYVDRRVDMWELLEIGLAPAEQGRGLGTAIVEFLKTAAVEAGALSLSLHVAIDNPRAAALYRRLGFHARDTASATHRQMEWRADAVRQSQE